jgi:hypothetical protein
MKTDPETEATAYGVGIGIVLIQACALFPGLLPVLLLLLPLVLPLLVLGLLAALVAAPIYGIRRLGTWALEGRSVRLRSDRLTAVPGRVSR